MTAPDATDAAAPLPSTPAETVAPSVDEVDAAPEEMGPAAWRSFGHDHANTRHNARETVLGPDNVHSLRERWSAEGAEVASTPVVTDGVVYYVDWDGLLHARDAQTGEEHYARAITDGASISATPLVTDDALYVGDSGGDFHAVDRDTGEVRWTVELDPHPDANIFSSAQLVDGLIVLGVASGEPLLPKLDYTFNGSVVALSPTDGHEVWRVYVAWDDGMKSGAGVSVWSSPSIDTERKALYIGTGQTYEPPVSPLANGLLALDTQSGDVLWHTQFTGDDIWNAWMLDPGPDADVGSTPNLFRIGERDVVGVGDKQGRYYALDRDDGEILWTTQLTGRSRLGGVMGASAYADGMIFVTSNEWAADFNALTLSIPDQQSTDNSSVLFALDAETGDIEWSAPLSHVTFGSCSVAGGVVYVGSSAGTVHAFEASSGAPLWEQDVGYNLASGQTVVDGRLFVSHGFQFVGASEGGGMRMFALDE